MAVIFLLWFGCNKLVNNNPTVAMEMLHRNVTNCALFLSILSTHKVCLPSALCVLPYSLSIVKPSHA